MARHKTIIINKEDLENLYLKKRLSLDLIASRFNCGERTIFDRLHEYGIPIRYDKERKDITKERLEDFYINKKMSIGKIAQVFECGKNTVWSKLCKYNIKNRTKSEALKGKYKIELPEEIKGLYINDKLSIGEIAEKFNCSSVTILKRLHYYNVPIRRERILISRRELENLYSNEGLNIYQIGERFDCSGVAILIKLKRHNIPTRRRGESAIGKYKIKMDEEKIINLYDEKKIPISEIKKLFNCHATTMQKRLKRCGVHIRSISEALKGNPSPMKGKHHTEETRKKLSILTVKQLASGGMKRKDTSIEKKLEEELKINFLYFQKQIPLCGVTVPDFYLPDYKLAIYADGDYWHNLESVKNRDRKQNEILKQNGYHIIRFWEHEINESVLECVNKIKNFIKI